MSITQNPVAMKKLKFNPFGKPYETPDVSLVYYESGSALCDTSADGGEIEPGTTDPWGNF